MISVVMATYNGEKFIHQQLQSILDQSVQADEVIICDDVSSDNTVKIIKDFINSNNLTDWQLIVNEQNLGYNENFLKGVKLSQGDYIFFADQDDLWKLNKIEDMVISANANPKAMCLQSGYENIDASSEIVNIKTNHNFKNDGSTKKFEFSYILKSWGSGFTMMIRKELKDYIFENQVEKFKCYDSHDTLFSQFAALIGENILIDEVLNQHRLHENNVTQKIKNKHLEDTKENRINGMKKYQSRYSTMLYFCNYLDSSKITIRKRRTLSKYIKYNENRIRLLETRNPIFILKLLTNINLYGDYKVFLGDIAYACGLNSSAK